MIKAILFDLDGTLINSAPVILKCFNETFEKVFPDIIITEEEKIEFLGPTLTNTFTQYTDNLGLVDSAIKVFNECSLKEHDDNNVIAFHDAEKLFLELKKQNIQIGIVTSKSSNHALLGIELNGLEKYIDVLVGSDHVVNHKPHPEALIKAINQLGLTNKEVIYVGDHENDILAAQAANVVSVGVNYSYRRQQMVASNPDYMIDKLTDVLKII